MRNQADSLAYQAEKTVRESGDKIPADIRAEIETGIKDVRDALSADGSAETIRRAMTALSEALQQAGSALYGQQEDGAGRGRAPEGRRGNAGGRGHRGGRVPGGLGAGFKPALPLRTTRGRSVALRPFWFEGYHRLALLAFWVMLVEIGPADREVVRPLFAGFPGLHGIVDAALEGTMGTVRADDASRPALVAITLDFHLLAGDPQTPLAEDVVRGLSPPWSVVTSSEHWEPLLRRIWGDELQTRTRVAFQPGEWDRMHLSRFREALPEGFTLKRVTAGDATRFAELEDSLVYNFPSLDEFVARGVGFGVEHEGRYVSGCSSFALSSRSLEFEIDTDPDFRGRGLAAACAAAMIEYCIDSGLEPCWDAHNDISAALAAKLGFVEPAPYTAFEVRPAVTSADD